MNKNLKKKKKGFTLVEVIIVLAIIAIIAAIAIPNLTQVRRQSKIKADRQSLESAVRTINMLITNDDFMYDTTGDTVIHITDDGVTVEDGTVSYPNSADGGITDINEAFQDNIQGPQQEGMNTFVITIDSDGNIETEVDNIE